MTTKMRIHVATVHASCARCIAALDFVFKSVERNLLQRMKY